MSRPLVPSFTVPGWTVPTWAPDTSYGAGANPWSSSPTKVLHPGAASVGFTPKQPVSAQAMNYLINAAYDVDDSTKTHAVALTSEVQDFAEDVVEYTGQLPALNFRPTVAISDARAAAWDASTLSWYVADHAGPQMKRSRDSGDTYGTVSVSGVQPSDVVTDMIFDGSGNCVASIANASSGADRIWECTAETWTRRQVSAFATTSDSAGVVYDPDTSRFILFQTTVAGAAKVARSSDRTTWTAATMPSSMASDVNFGGIGHNVTVRA